MALPVVGRIMILVTLAMLATQPVSAGSAPPVLLGSVEGSDVTLSWVVLADVDMYTLQRITEAGTTFIYLDGSVNQYTEALEGDMAVTFVLTSTSQGEESAPSNPVIIPNYPHCSQWGGLDLNEPIPVYVYKHCFHPLPI